MVEHTFKEGSHVTPQAVLTMWYHSPPLCISSVDLWVLLFESRWTWTTLTNRIRQKGPQAVPERGHEDAFHVCETRLELLHLVLSHRPVGAKRLCRECLPRCSPQSHPALAAWHRCTTGISLHDSCPSWGVRPHWFLSLTKLQINEQNAWLLLYDAAVFAAVCYAGIDNENYL